MIDQLTNNSKTLNINERLFQKSLEQFPVIDFDFFNAVQFDAFYDKEYGYNLHITHLFMNEDDEFPNKYGMVHRTSVTKDSLSELAEVILSFIQTGMYQDVEKLFYGMLFNNEGDVVDEIDWMEELSKSDDIAKILGLDENGEENGKTFVKGEYKNSKEDDEDDDCGCED